jgi:hypothetical protein
MAAMTGSTNGIYQTSDRSGEVVRTIRADETYGTVSAGSRSTFRISFDPNATGTPTMPRKTFRRVGDIVLFEDGSWIPFRKLSRGQKKGLGL